MAAYQPVDCLPGLSIAPIRDARKRGTSGGGFVEEHQYRKLADVAGGKLWMRTLLALGYTYGFRKAELLEMRCNQVDLLNNTVCLYAGETKNGEGR
jgi:integrase